MRKYLYGLALFVALAPICGFAAVAPAVGYYGKDFAPAKEQGDALRDRLHDTLRGNHSQGPDGFDAVGGACGGKCYSHQVIGYDAARRFLLGDYYLVPVGSAYGVRDVYCDRVIQPEEFRGEAPRPGRVPDHTVVNVEHTWPQSEFSRGFLKEEQKSDLHHLFATDSEMNSRRSSFPFGDVTDSRGELKCPVARLGGGRGDERIVFEPPSNHKGNVARAMFYFAVRYEMQIPSGEEGELRRWHKEDPVDAEERARNERIFEVQKSRNPFVDYPEMVDRIRDF